MKFKEMGAADWAIS